jgi:hypothetical protein
MFEPDDAVAGPLFVIARSVDSVAVVLAVEELLAGVGSDVADETVAVFEMVPANDELDEYVLVIVTVAAGARVPREQGNGVVQPPLFETNVVFAGVGSATETLVAVLGPLFVTVIV